jgi:hypothetical protein
MKPEFALSLSFEGISLLYRIDGGWHLMGEAALTSETLGADLEALRDMAESIGGKTFRTKIVLPNEQIKYLSLATGKVNKDARRAAVSDELEATTPYRIDELAFDMQAAGAETKAAAVARETLSEAEAFAVEHAFNPVCFVAIPPEGAFSGEPFFGATEVAGKLLGKETAEADDLPIHVISSGPLPEPAPESPSEPKPEPAPVSAPPAPEPDPAPEHPLSEEAGTATAPETTPEEEVAAPAPVADPAPTFGSRRKSSPALHADRTTGAPVASGETTLTASRQDKAALRFDPARVAAGLRPHGPIDAQDGTDSTAPRKTALAQSASGAMGAVTAFLSRRRETRKNRRAASATATATADAVPGNERQRMTVFGARAGEIGGKPRHLGLVLTIILLIFLAAVAAWAALFTEEGVAGLFQRDPPQQIADTAPESQPVEDPVEEQETAALPPVSPDTIIDSAEIEAMTDEHHPTALDSLEAEARYAATGIWQRAPDPSLSPDSGSTEDLYLTSIDRVVIAKDAVALPALASFGTDRMMPRQLSPLPPGLRFDLDDRGLVKATPEGALSPEGIRVYLGRPAALPAAYPIRQAAPGEALPPVERARIAKLRPRLRPTDLVEQNERASNGGRSLAELGKMRPRLRPATQKAEEEAGDVTASQYAVTASLRPKPRPENFEAVIARADPEDRVQPTAAAATVAPSIPSSASVARQATIQNAMNLRKVNLIGVYGTSSSRRALVRLSNGRFKKVQVGDRIDGGKVAAIGDTELRYIKSGKNVVLKLPRG